MRLKLFRLAECAWRSQTRLSHAGANDCDVDHGRLNWGVFKTYVAEVSSKKGGNLSDKAAGRKSHGFFCKCFLGWFSKN